MVLYLNRFCFSVLSILFLSSCNTIVLNPAGDVAYQESRLIIIATALMLLIVIPVIGLIFLFIKRYHQNNITASYKPNWNYSFYLEILIWGGPLLIILILSSLTWINTHALDPYQKLARLDKTRYISKNTKSLTIEVVALDWKWLFIYPEQSIASLNEIVAPINVPIHFKITASSVMNSFYIPALAGQIYAMPGMQTELHAVINKLGKYSGFSANYSGAGFSDMNFKFYAVSNINFNKWINVVKSSNSILKKRNYSFLAIPSVNHKVQYFKNIDHTLYLAILHRSIKTP